MEIDWLTSSLQQEFGHSGGRVVFWNNLKEHFVNILHGTRLEGVKMINFRGASTLRIKTQIELGPPERKYLLHSPAEVPKPKDDRLCNMRLYSRSFRTDRTTVLLRKMRLVECNLAALSSSINYRLQVF